jgi:topoisomerase-4 subunit B
VVDNCIDEFIMGHGKTIDIKVSGQKVTVRDYGRGIPLGKVIDCVSKINTGGKYDTAAFKKSVGLNGIGTKAVNALSDAFTVQSVRDGEMKLVDYSRGEIVQDYKIEKSSLRNGTKVVFQPDSEIFKNFHYLPEYIEDQIWNYVYLNSGLNIQFNGEKYFSENGLKDLLERKTDMEKIRYPVIHLRGDDIEVALTHGDQYGEEYYSFVNGQHTTQGGTHLAAFREAIVRTMREYYKKDFDASDIRASIIGAISLRIQNPIFESQTKTRLGSIELSDDGPTVRIFINDFIKRELDNFLHQNTDIADYLLKRIMQSERERKDLAGIKKLANQRAKKANLHNKKLRDCKVHLNDEKADDEKRLNSTIFITEGDSASGSITKSRDVATQAVFSLRGKPLNSFGMKKKVVYENEEFNLLQHALNIEEGLDNLRYNQVVVATDADVDGMHIRLLILTFFLQFFPDLVKNGHVYILETPLFRVRNKKKTLYCFSENEKKSAINTLGGNPEITRFKGLGEISPEEFGLFIGESIRLEPVIIRGKTSVNDLLKYYMGKNTEERQKFIIENLRVEDDELENIHG